MFRHGKLAFLTTKDDRIKIIHERIDLTEKHLIEICSGFSLCVRKLAKYRNASDDLARTFKHYAEEEEINESLGDGLLNLTATVTILADHMDMQVQRMEAKIISEITQFENLCKTTRCSLRAAIVARDKESAADSELLKSKMDVNRANKEIDEIISNFEKRKLSDLKKILTDFILISMKYHTRCLETLSTGYFNVSNIDENDDFEEFQKLMKTKEEPQTLKSVLRKGLRSLSMENLEGEQFLSPRKRRGMKVSRSTKNLAARNGDDTAKEDNDSEEEDSEAHSNLEEDDSATHSEEDDEDDDEEDEEEEEEQDAAKESAADGLAKRSLKTNSLPQIKHTFKAIAGSQQALKGKTQQRLKSSSSKGGLGIPKQELPPVKSAGAAVKGRRHGAFAAAKRGNGGGGDGGDIATNTDGDRLGGGRVVTFVESKKKHDDDD